jgi:hypothetical protein
LYHILLQGTSRTREILLGQTQEEAAAVSSVMIQKYDEITASGKRCLAMPAVISSGCKPTTSTSWINFVTVDDEVDQMLYNTLQEVIIRILMQVCSSCRCK